MISILFLYLFILFINLNFYLLFQKFTKLLNFYDEPKKNRKIHSSKVSLLGGLIFFLTILIFILFDYFFLKKNIIFFNFSVIFSLISIFILGAFDDKYDLNAIIKSIFFLIIFSIAIFQNENLIINELRFSFFETINITDYAKFIFTIFCIFLFINAFNMFDGVNGQSSLYIIIIFLYFLFKGIFINLSIAILITGFIFLFFNIRNKIFLGDNGTLTISLLLSMTIIYAYNNNFIIYADEIFILMMLPGLDMARLFIQRIITRKNPLSADKDHFHHLLIKKIGIQKIFIVSNLIILLPIISMEIGISKFLIITLFSILYLFAVIYLKKTKI